mmetsp:Transcript_5344/g.13019  ORF Transcript_5344/g.13019 Transcript_5344/m.13019 type:complete len:210 (-) Transcript_5344:229-858(-)
MTCRLPCCGVRMQHQELQRSHQDLPEMPWASRCFARSWPSEASSSRIFRFSISHSRLVPVPAPSSAVQSPSGGGWESMRPRSFACAMEDSAAIPPASSCVSSASETCLRRFPAVGSGVDGSCEGTDRSHSCSRHRSAEGRSSGLKSRSFNTRSLAAGDIVADISSSDSVKRRLRIESLISSSVFPSNARLPVRRAYRTQPSDHMSIAMP